MLEGGKMIDFQFRPLQVEWRPRYDENNPWVFRLYVLLFGFTEMRDWLLLGITLNEVAGFKQERAKVRLILFNRLFEFGVTKKLEGK